MEGSDQPHIHAPLPSETNWYPLHGKPVGYQSTFWLFENYINVLSLPVKTAVQSAALLLHKLRYRDALNHPLVTVLSVYHEPRVTTQMNVLATNRGNGNFHTSHLFRVARNFKGGYTLLTLPRIVTPYRDSVDGTRDRVTYQKLVTR
jgi:hypothetical protein